MCKVVNNMICVCVLCCAVAVSGGLIDTFIRQSIGAIARHLELAREPITCISSGSSCGERTCVGSDRAKCNDWNWMGWRWSFISLWFDVFCVATRTTNEEGINEMFSLIARDNSFFLPPIPRQHRLDSNSMDYGGLVRLYSVWRFWSREIPRIFPPWYPGIGTWKNQFYLIFGIRHFTRESNLKPHVIDICFNSLSYRRPCPTTVVATSLFSGYVDDKTVANANQWHLIPANIARTSIIPKWGPR